MPSRSSPRARGAQRLIADVSDTALPFFQKRGFQPQRRNTVPLGDEWLANTTMEKRSRRRGDGSVVMSRERLYLFDTTLRDGAQTTGVDFSLEDKRAIAALLDRLGIDYVEGGYPGANPLDTTFFAEKRTAHAKFTAFGMTKRAGRSASNDPGIAALLEAQADAICFVAKAWDYHVRVALESTTRGKSRRHPRQRRGRARKGPRGAARLRAFLRRLQGQSRLCARLREDGL